VHIHHRHSWDLTPKEAVALQKELRAEVVTTRPLDLARVRLVAGVDVSVKEGISQAAVVVASFPDLQLVEVVRASRPTPFPYVPGLLSFREGPVLDEAFENLTVEPDAFIFDGSGYAHPRRIGIACHLGLWLDRPTIGCSKTRLTGQHEEVPPEKGAWAPLLDKGEVVGCALRTRAGTNPVFVSPGHLIDLASAIDLVMRCSPKYRLPEPIRLAHNAAGAFEREA
jgi:deoxyribonuclease V